MKRKSIIAISASSIIVFGFLTMSVLSGMKEEPKKRKPPELVRYVKAEKINYDDIKSPLTASGRVYSISEVALSAEVSGKILTGDIPFKKGQSFKEGDVLIKIYEKDAKLSLQSRKSSFLNHLAGILPDLKIDFSENYDKWYNFFEKIEIDKDLPELPKIASTKEKVFLASRSILSDYYSIRSDETRLKKYKIVAPFDGSFAEVSKQVGAIASPGQKLATIINTKDLEVEVPVEVSEAKWITVGDKVTAFSEDQKVSYEGKVIRISSAIDPEFQSLSVFVKLNNHSRKSVYKGEYLEVTFPGGTLKNVMEIPRSAVFNSDVVFTVKNNKLQKSKIDIQKINEKTLLFNGLEEGEQIVVEPLINANENTKVEILKK